MSRALLDRFAICEGPDLIIKGYCMTNSTRLGKVAFWLALIPWFYIVPAMLGIPGFG